MTISRREFFRTTGIGMATAGIISQNSFPQTGKKDFRNKLPKWKGFNLLDYFSPQQGGSPNNKTSEDDFRWMRDWGFNFVRLPMAYPGYLKFDRSRNITPDEVYKVDEEVVGKIYNLVTLAHKYHLHVSLNLHRAPGYCVNSGFFEPYNLWKDQEALDAFCFHWEMWAKLFKEVSPKKISFDLVNEPGMREDMNDQHSKRGPVPGQVYRKVAKAAAEKIWSVNPDHMVIADGNNTGSTVIPEITDLNIAQSCRGYFPGHISHFKAPWAVKDPEKQPVPVYPEKSAAREFGRAQLEDFYKPWLELVRTGVGVHCGECGCWKKTPHEVFLAWFGDVTDILSHAGIGYALWNFRGDFGILDSGREDVNYTDWHGHKLDSKLLSLLTK